MADQIDFREICKERRLVTDGAMGTYYPGEIRGRRRHPELDNETAPERIREIHREYIRAGGGHPADQHLCLQHRDARGRPERGGPGAAS